MPLPHDRHANPEYAFYLVEGAWAPVSSDPTAGAPGPWASCSDSYCIRVEAGGQGEGKGCAYKGSST